ncbi:hypothetical protein ACT5AY_001464 [Pseudomonas aeruginosa]|uniref:hypothetical protein n=1 Tax=Pseudomonas aeruginosa group TaxID=136841 RepID=UPI000AFDF6A0|nr:hypothetical protein [Pseudomonas paraeruginosa]MBG5161884.1 hypothetical protein [Pseudomonas aeruginosa]MBH3771473.1 hypothetical protein [Pseudomonas aeruginosa]RTT26704.1 hypothetical protein DY956_30295 [Pseudomonas paraeruginosa]HEK1481300.1 hypothetical protein [Pseudomonas aeruginosa]
MSDDLIRLSEFVPEHARYHGLDIPTAAHDLTELIDALTHKHLGTTGKDIPPYVCWVGGVANPHQSTKRCKPDYKNLIDYFKSWSVAPTGNSQDFLDCYSETERDYIRIPAAIVYFSRTSLLQWIQAAKLDCPGFLKGKSTEESAINTEEGCTFKGKELVTVQGLTRGLIEIIVAVDRAHRGLTDEASAAAIIRAVSQLELAGKASKWHAALTELAELAGIDDFRSNRRTLRKYIGNHS